MECSASYSLIDIQEKLSNLHLVDEPKNKTDKDILNLNKKIKKLNISNSKKVEKKHCINKFNVKLIKKTDYYYIARYYDYDDYRELINNQNHFFKKAFKNEIEFLRKNNFTDKLIEGKINEGRIVRSCHEILKNSFSYVTALKNFHKTGEKLLKLDLKEGSFSFTKYKVKNIFIRSLAYMNLETKSGNFQTQDAKGKNVHFITYLTRENNYHLAIWSGQTAFDESNSEINPWKIFSGQVYVIQKIYDLTTKNYFVLKSVNQAIMRPDLYAESLFNSKAMIDEICEGSHPFIQSGICPILTTIKSDGLNASIMPKMDGDGIDFAEYWESKIPMSKKEFLFEFYRLINVLAEAHEKGIHYGDFKVDNFLFKFDQGKVRFFLADWEGCLRNIEKNIIESYETQMFTGPYTPRYCHANDIPTIRASVNEFLETMEDFRENSAGNTNGVEKKIQKNFEKKIRKLLEKKVIYSIGVTLWNILVFHSFNEMAPLPTYEELCKGKNLKVNELKMVWGPEFISTMLWMLNEDLHDRPSFKHVTSVFEKILTN